VKIHFAKDPVERSVGLQQRPWFATKHLRKTSGFAMRSLGLDGGATRSNSGDLAGELGRGVAGEGLGVERTRSRCSLVAKTGPAGGHSGGREMQPQQPQCRRGGGTTSARSGGGSSYRA
jgi:hypothetical protein